MFESLQEGLGSALKSLRGRGKLTEANMREALGSVQTALLEGAAQAVTLVIGLVGVMVFMLGIMRDTNNDMRMRMHACQAVLPYVAARLNAVDINVTSDLDTMTLAEKLDRVTQLRTGIMEQRPDLQLPKMSKL